MASQACFPALRDPEKQDFDSFMDSLIEATPDVPVQPEDMELFSAILPDNFSVFAALQVSQPSNDTLALPLDPKAPTDGLLVDHARPYGTAGQGYPAPAYSEHASYQAQPPARPQPHGLRAASGNFASTSQGHAADGQHRATKPRKPPSAASLAQKKYMGRQKMKMADSERRVAELSAALEGLLREKQELEVKERIMRYALDGITIHMDHLFADKVVREFQQLELIKHKAQLQSLVEGRPVSVEEARGWPLAICIRTHFQRYLARLEQLIPAAKADPGSPEAGELQQLVALHRQFDRPGAVASCFHWALFSWNLEESQRRRHEPKPDLPAILEELAVTREQQQQLLDARRVFLGKMADIDQRRRDVLSQLGLQMLCGPKEQMHQCPAAMDLYNSLRQEQTTVLGFILNADAVLTPVQEALLDVRSAPWCPDMLALTGLLAGQEAAPPDFRWLRPSGETLVMPRATPYEVLTMPLTGMGCGKNLRWGVVMCPSWTVLSILCCPQPSQRRLDPMSLLAICCGRWRRFTAWEWLVQVRRTGALFENPLVEPEDAPPQAASGAT